MKKIFALNCALLAVLNAACGEAPKPGASAPDVSPTAKVQNVDASAPIKSVTWTLREPPSAGANWARVFKVDSTNPGLLVVQKRWAGASEWGPAIGVTTAAGEFIDPEISASAEYLFGQSVETGRLEGVSDYVLTGEFCARETVRAYRVIVPTGLRINDCSLFVDAEIFQLDQGIMAYAGTAGGRNAPTIVIKARIARGDGTIYLEGDRGVMGASGREAQYQGTQLVMGAMEAQPGGRGGNGGTLEVYAVQNSLSKFNVSGGPAGIRA